MKSAHHVVFVTTSNLATNPRLVKEVELALSLSYQVTVLAFSFQNWSLQLNNNIKGRLGSEAKIIELSAERDPFLPWALSTTLQIVCKLLVKLGSDRPAVLSQALQKRSILLVQALQKLTAQPTFIVAHNPGSFYPVMQYAQKKKIPFGIDVEDYHPGETNDFTVNERMRKLMQQTIQQAKYVTAAAPLILKQIKEDCGNRIPDSGVVLNYFSSTEFRQPVKKTSDKLRLVWFSQHIAEGRGLERLLEAMKLFPNTVELHLFGHLNSDYEQKYLLDHRNVIIHAPLPQEDLHAQLANYDIGIALEDAAANYNRDICITNKLLAYYQAGLYILASTTKAQQEFFDQHKKHGNCIPVSLQSLTGGIQQLVDEMATIRLEAATRFNDAAVYSAEKEISQIANYWEEILKG